MMKAAKIVSEKSGKKSRLGMWSIATDATFRHPTAMLMRRAIRIVKMNSSPAAAARM